MKYIPLIQSEIELEYTRSRGPGGQHVNKTNSAAILRWNISSSQLIKEETRNTLLEKLKNKITVDGDLLIRCEQYRDQDQNREDCLKKLDLLISEALFVPKKRKATKPTRAAQNERKDQKKHRGKIKSARGKVRSWE